MVRDRGSALLGFSGGVDSAYLASVAVDALGADRFLAVIGRSASYPEEQWREARAVADRFGIPVIELDTDELHDPSYAANPTNRCYFCKAERGDDSSPLLVRASSRRCCMAPTRTTVATIALALRRPLNASGAPLPASD